MLPCGVPASSRTLCDMSFPSLTCIFLLCRNDDMIRSSVGESFMLCSFLRRPLCHTASKAFSTSINKRAASFFLFCAALM